MKNKVWAFQPYDQDGNLADAYNRHCALVPNSNDWIVLRDADLMMLTPEYEKVMLEVAEANPQFDLWTIYVNRVRCRPQLQKDMFYVDEMSEHRKRAVYLYENHKYDVKQIHRVISGYVMMFRKKTWERFPFRGRGLFGVDTHFSRDILRSGGSIGLMEGVYGMHYYRFNDNINFKPYRDGDKGHKK